MGKKKSAKKNEESGDVSSTSPSAEGESVSVKSVDLCPATEESTAAVGDSVSVEAPLSTIETALAAAAPAPAAASRGWGLGQAFKGLFGRAKQATTTIIPGAGPHKAQDLSGREKAVSGGGGRRDSSRNRA